MSRYAVARRVTVAPVALAERSRRDREDRVRIAGGGPHGLEAQQVLVQHRAHGRGMADGRDAADRVARDLAHVGRVGALDRLADRGRDQRHRRRGCRRRRARAPARRESTPAHHERLDDRAELRSRPRRRPRARCGSSPPAAWMSRGQSEREQRVAHAARAAGQVVHNARKRTKRVAGRPLQPLLEEVVGVGVVVERLDLVVARGRGVERARLDEVVAGVDPQARASRARGRRPRRPRAARGRRRGGGTPARRTCASARRARAGRRSPRARRPKRATKNAAKPCSGRSPYSMSTSDSGIARPL